MPFWFVTTVSTGIRDDRLSTEAVLARLKRNSELLASGKVDISLLKMDLNVHWDIGENFSRERIILNKIVPFSRAGLIRNVRFLNLSDTREGLSDYAFRFLEGDDDGNGSKIESFEYDNYDGVGMTIQELTRLDQALQSNTGNYLRKFGIEIGRVHV